MEDDRSLLQLYNIFNLVAIVVLYYDHTLTSDDEISYIWKKPWRFGKTCFMLNRYFAILSNAFVMYEAFNDLSPQRVDNTFPAFYLIILTRCSEYDLVHELGFWASQIFVTTLMVLRVYALYGCSKRMLAGLAGAAVLLTLIQLILGLRGRPTVALGMPSCILFPRDDAVYYLAGVWEAGLAFDTLIFILTVSRTWSSSPLRSRNLMNWWGIGRLFLRDAFRDYFNGISAFAYPADVKFGPPLLKGSLATLANIIGVTMMSRLTLNLYRHLESTVHETPQILLTTLGPSNCSGVASEDRLHASLPVSIISSEHRVAALA
ncbi:hypothetical protein GLOTRDRAFT_138792 [Gloeophyllum trabeum ATCC 11539]|uniref:DUF6533 domain-containing protein n=1 Tax=Gloeophyllum trabeum (strain ATCC 11539 / FP-39264 / Madison 617) TaxID=670483 RepID=S7RQH1_GLOTA|nr:uncharacterized protein GLOTRDRAFT_138792 [Gloeophyllum trabeum ATCC 11539]EPQ55139.1 hypothetical protein GLOTRDRAFT_138792 [Gloeophyllum trabeum ATCC 11539]